MDLARLTHGSRRGLLADTAPQLLFYIDNLDDLRRTAFRGTRKMKMSSKVPMVKVDPLTFMGPKRHWIMQKAL